MRFPFRVAIAIRATVLLWLPGWCGAVAGETVLVVDPGRPRQCIEGMGCGAIFFEGHITSLAAQGRQDEQKALYDAMFRDVRTDFLQLMIRHDHEPVNDNADPGHMEFKRGHFAYLDHTMAICREARARRPGIRFHAVLYTPPPWMKTNGSESAGGNEWATLKEGMELEFAEFAWAFLAAMARAGLPVEFLSIANEPDWPHEQPGYCLTPESNARLTRMTVGHFKRMAGDGKTVPLPKFVGPNTLSAVDAAARWLPVLDREAPGAIKVVGSHDYDRRGARIADLVAAARGRPVWVTEWCVNAKDSSPDLINPASEYWLAMTEAFNQGASAWFAYDWVYPPRDGGEALIHVNWGKSFHKTRIYYGFRQWCAPLEPGMRVVTCELRGEHATGISMPGVKAAAFLDADGGRLVVHAANVGDSDTRLRIDPGPRFRELTPRRWRTSATEEFRLLENETSPVPATVVDLPERSMNTWEWTLK
jgi:O-glycosyl hydrolase